MADLLSYALCSLQDTKESLGIASGVTTHDNLLKRKINQATEMIEGYCKRRFKETTYADEQYDGTSSNQLILRQYPVSTTASFTLSERNTTLNDDDWTTIDSDLYFIDYNAGVIDGKVTFLRQWNLYKTTYTAGYSTIPSDLAEACVTLACFLYENSTSGTAVKRKKEGQREIEYHDPNSGANSAKSLFEQLNIDDILNRYAYNRLIEDV